ncbi:uncharacterized protein LOC117216804 [Bombus bifarius]|uniref:Uncharacterized protein LOC117216804 n=1 Tax=Bombus bifarius TaxID=103933 RepID=A0A6P8P002_9HYME|nr:uncharacterized protein LOC117164412 [Bombus vancouverensis nearcticus]XP_033319735.1 uncharacterized protein LOC117216804 [Bombus bifarius]
MPAQFVKSDAPKRAKLTQPESVAHKEHTSPSKDIEERSSTKDDYGKHTRHSLLIHGRLTAWWRGSAKRLQRMEKRKISWTSTVTRRCEKKRVELKGNLSTVSVISLPEN